MTSFTRKLFNRDPAAAAAFEQSQRFDHRLVYGKHVTLAGFTMASRPVMASFGKRAASGKQACLQRCGHPACKAGCTLYRK